MLSCTDISDYWCLPWKLKNAQLDVIWAPPSYNGAASFSMRIISNNTYMTDKETFCPWETKYTREQTTSMSSEKPLVKDTQTDESGNHTVLAVLVVPYAMIGCILLFCIWSRWKNKVRKDNSYYRSPSEDAMQVRNDDSAPPQAVLYDDFPPPVYSTITEHAETTFPHPRYQELLPSYTNCDFLNRNYILTLYNGPPLEYRSREHINCAVIDNATNTSEDPTLYDENLENNYQTDSDWSVPSQTLQKTNNTETESRDNT